MELQARLMKNLPSRNYVDGLRLRTNGWLMAISSHLAPKLSFPIKVAPITHCNNFHLETSQVTLAYKSYDTVPNTIKDSCVQV